MKTRRASLLLLQVVFLCAAITACSLWSYLRWPLLQSASSQPAPSTISAPGKRLLLLCLSSTSSTVPSLVLLCCVLSLLSAPFIHQRDSPAPFPVR